MKKYCDRNAKYSASSNTVTVQHVKSENSCRYGVSEAVTHTSPNPSFDANIESLPVLDIFA